MSTKTRDQLVDRALQKLMIVGSGQAPQAEDQELVDGFVDTTIDDLSARDIIVIQDDDAIEFSMFEWLADCLSQNAASSFGKPRDPNLTEYAEAKLKRIRFVDPTYQVLTSEHF